MLAFPIATALILSAPASFTGPFVSIANAQTAKNKETQTTAPANPMSTRSKSAKKETETYEQCLARVRANGGGRRGNACR
jgi:hypothetical protein